MCSWDGHFFYDFPCNFLSNVEKKVGKRDYSHEYGLCYFQLIKEFKFYKLLNLHFWNYVFSFDIMSI